MRAALLHVCLESEICGEIAGLVDDSGVLVVEYGGGAWGKSVLGLHSVRLKDEASGRA